MIGTETGFPGSTRGSRRIRRVVAAALLAAATVLALAAAPAGAYEHRRNTPSVGGQLQYGDLQYDSDWGDYYGAGRGGAVRLRQYIARNRALGLSFELQKFRRASNRGPEVDGFHPDYWQAQILMVDYYAYIRRPSKVTQYVVGAAGFYRPEIVDEVKAPAGGKAVTVVHPTEGLLARLGVGTEYFVARTFSIDASVSGYYFGSSGRTA